MTYRITLLHNTAHSHVANTMQTKLQHMCWELLEHLVYSLDLPTCVQQLWATEAGTEELKIPMTCSSEKKLKLFPASLQHSSRKASSA